jgi:hypothetical protein
MPTDPYIHATAKSHRQDVIDEQRTSRDDAAATRATRPSGSVARRREVPMRTAIHSRPRCRAIRQPRARTARARSGSLVINVTPSRMTAHAGRVIEIPILPQEFE